MTATEMPMPMPTQMDPSPPPALESPSRNDGVTIACAVCGRHVTAVGRRRFCSHACRQAAFRQRQQVATTVPATPRPVPRTTTVYECPACGTRFLGEQRCAECNVFCRRVGPGGPCPHCDEPVTVTDLLPAG